MDLIRAPISTLLACMLACASSGGPPSTPTTPAGRTPGSTTAPGAAAAMSWTPRHTSAVLRYEVRTEGTIQLDSDTARQEMPIESTLLYTVTLAPQGELLRITGVVDSVSMRNQQASQNPDSSAFRNRWTGLVTALGRVSTTQAESTACHPDRQIPLQPIHEILISHPPTMTAGAQWKDTTTTLTCRGEVTVSTIAINSYRVDGAENHRGTQTLRVTRSSEVTIRGSGRESGRSVSLAGGGGGTSTLYLDQQRGTLISSSGETRTVITLRTLTGEIPFRQHIRQEITQRP